MTDQEQWTSGPLPSDDKLGTDSLVEEADQVRTRRQVAGAADETVRGTGGDGGTSDDDAQPDSPEDTGATGTLDER